MLLRCIYFNDFAFGDRHIGFLFLRDVFVSVCCLSIYKEYNKLIRHNSERRELHIQHVRTEEIRVEIFTLFKEISVDLLEKVLQIPTILNNKRRIATW